MLKPLKSVRGYSIFTSSYSFLSIREVLCTYEYGPLEVSPTISATLHAKYNSFNQGRWDRIKIPSWVTSAEAFSVAESKIIIRPVGGKK